jgi:16S rRNA (cytosine967-C5)-methyltransferase
VTTHKSPFRPKHTQGRNLEADSTTPISFLYRYNQWRQAQLLWQEWLTDKPWHQLDVWLKRRLAQNKQFGKRDRLIYGDILFNATRFGYWAGFVVRHNKTSQNQLGAALAEFSTLGSNATRLKQQLLYIAQSQHGLPFLQLCQWRALCVTKPTPLPQDLAEFKCWLEQLETAAKDNRTLQLLWQGIPVNYQDAIERLPAPDAFLQLQSSRPPLWLRSNNPAATDAIEEQLRTDYHVIRHDQALGVDGQTSIYQQACYQEGLVEIQDWASQQLALKVEAKAGDKVWDACAGGGGKTLAIASRMNNKGVVWATDIREHKLQEVKRRAKQAQFFNLRTAHWDAEADFVLPKEAARQGGFDWVLVDAPCSSSGTWRRNPDAKLRSLGEPLQTLTDLQLKILLRASAGVAPAGKLVYGTCSFFTDENDGVIARFLDTETAWQLDDSGLLGCPNEDSDTLFYAVLSRKTSTDTTGQ